jgi:hypothetical protein
MRRRSLPALLWILCLAAPRALAAPRPIATAPLKVLRTGHVTVEVKVNDRGPFRLALDTGSPITFLSGRAAQKAGLIRAEVLKRPAFLGERGEATAKTITVGGAQVRNLRIFILDHPALEALSQFEGRIDGIVGFTFFAHFRTTINYAAGRVSFVPVDYQPEDVSEAIYQRLSRAEGSKRIVVPAALWGMAVEKSDEAAGVVVRQVYAKSAVDAAGLRPGDRILTIGGRWTDSVLDCYEAAALVRPGQLATLRVLRAGKERELKVRPRVGL